LSHALAYVKADAADAVIETLLEAIDDRSWVVRHSAVDTLLHLRHPRSKPAIFRAILDRDSLISFGVIRAATKDEFFCDAAAIPPLRKLVKDERLKKRDP